MPHQWVRANLASAIFPFETTLQGRTVIIPGVDMNYNYIDQIGEPIRDRGVPQVFYLHNVLPTPQGYQAIGYAPKIAPLVGASDFDTVHSLDYTNTAVARFLLVPSAGKNYVFDATVGVWVSVNPQTAGSLPQNVLVTSGHVNGASLFFYAYTGMYFYDETAKTISAQSLTGVTVSAILGMVCASGYNIVYDEKGNISWSSATDPSDFTPSLITGAGGGVVQYCKGNVRFAVPLNDGFLLYCERNIVSARYSGNINFPWVFTEVKGSAGVESIEHVSYTGDVPYHFAWTAAGIMQITADSASLAFPEASTFLSALIFEDFNESTIVFTQEFLSFHLFLKVAFIAKRYLILSYGKTNGVYTHALVYDNLLARWGKIKYTHVKCFEWTVPNLFGAITYGQLSGVSYGELYDTTYGELSVSVNLYEQPSKNIAFMQQDGTIVTVNMDLSESTANGVLLIGKFQMSRNRWIGLQMVDISNTQLGNNFSAYGIVTYDGVTFEPATSLTADPNNILLNKPNLIRLGGQELKGQNISLLMLGSFNAVSLDLNLTVGGYR